MTIVKKILNFRLTTSQILFYQMAFFSLSFCAVAFFAFPSLDNDEACVAFSLIKNPNAWEFFNRLPYGVQFPRLYLITINFLQSIFGYQLWVLRLLPFLFGVGGVIIWLKNFQEEYFNKKNNRVFLLASCFFTTSVIIYFYAGSLKQYSADLFFAGAGYWWMKKKVATALHEESKVWIRNSLLWLLPIFLSYPYIFFVFCGGLTIISGKDWSVSKKVKIRLLILFVTALLFFAALWIMELRFSQDGGFLKAWKPYLFNDENLLSWVKSAGIMILSLLSQWWDASQWWNPLYLGPISDMRLGLTRGIAILSAVAILGASVAIISRKKVNNLTRMGVFLFWTLFFLALLEKYPVSPRLWIIFFPFQVALLTWLLNGPLEKSRKFLKWATILLSWIVIVFLFLFQLNILYFCFAQEKIFTLHNLTPALKELDPNESKYVYVNAKYPFEYQLMLLCYTWPGRPKDFNYFTDSLPKEFSGGQNPIQDMDSLGKEAYHQIVSGKHYLLTMGPKRNEDSKVKQLAPNLYLINWQEQ